MPDLEDDPRLVGSRATGGSGLASSATSKPMDLPISLLRSPVTHAALLRRDDELHSQDGSERFPIVDGIPVLLDDSRSAFSTSSFLSGPGSGAGATEWLRRLAKRLVPDVTHNMAAEANYRLLLETLTREADRPNILVVGGSILGQSFEIVADSGRVDLVETDVAYGPRTGVICDAQALPFADGSFDAVVCQAVLEHVTDPPLAVSEIHRVLRPRGIVYSEIPFMQQVHEGAYDFTRYTLIGHRRLYRDFDCLKLGVTAGPGTALAWSIKYFWLSLTGRSPLIRGACSVVLNLLLFWIKYVDYLLVRSPGFSDAASGTFFLGRRSDRTLSDRELLAQAGAGGSGYRLTRS